MSLLEDVFLQDEAGEAHELERIIEGDEYDERRPSSPDSNSNSEKEDEAEEDKRRVETGSAKPKRIVKNPRVILNPARLTGPRGIQVLPEHFKDFKFKGKGHEKEDLDLVLKKLEHWAYRLFPKFEFEDCLKKIETLGKKRPVMVHLTKIRTDQYMSEETVVQRDSSDDEAPPAPVQEEDEFDKLLQQQIELARATPAPGFIRKPAFSTPMTDKTITMPKATSSPSINEEQRERMLRNRQLAEERRLARLKQNTSETNTSLDNASKDSDIAPTDNIKAVSTEKTGQEIDDITDKVYEDEIPKVRNNRSNVIDSSDEDDTLVINESVTVDVHNSRRNSGEESHMDGQSINTVIDGDIEEISGINDVVMNENDECKVSSNDDNVEHIPDEIKVPADDSNKKFEKTLESNNFTDSSKSKSTVVFTEHVTSNSCKDDKNCEVTADVQDIEEIENIEAEKEKTLENYEKDIMDVDFSDDF